MIVVRHTDVIQLLVSREQSFPAGCQWFLQVADSHYVNCHRNCFVCN